jgi:type II secretory pathway component GspD/PulD (secretin)
MNTKLNHAMKKIAYTLLLGLSSVMVAGAQTDSTAPTQPADASNAVPAAVQSAAPADTNAPAASQATPPADTNAPAAMPAGNAADTNAPAATPAGNAADTNAPAAMPAGAAAEPSATPAAPAPAGIPHIAFNDVPIRTAIEHLARMANINYMLDPKIGYGEPDANGQIKVEPMLSIRWENITAENALLALLDNYGLQMISDKRTGIHRITLKDPAAPPPLYTKVVQLKYASVSNMMEAAQSVLTDRRSKVLADVRTSQMIVVATDPEQVAIETLVNQLDKPTRQVLIETRLIEISSNPRTQKGVDWTKTLAAQEVSFGNGKSFGKFDTSFPGPTGTDPLGQPTSASSYGTAGAVTTITGNGGFNWNTRSGLTPDIGFLNADGLNAVMSFLNSSKDAQIMSTPRVVTLDNEMATIQVYRTFPIFTTTAGTANTAGGSSINYSNVGTMLHVTPRISANDYIWLKVIPEVSSYFGDFKQVVPNTGTQGGSSIVTAPQFDIRSVTTQVLIPNSNTLVMGGLVQDNPSQNSTKVPLLGDIPGIGQLFRSEDKQMNKDNLLIFITPTIVTDNDFQASKSGDFLKSKAQEMKNNMDPKSAWDGSQPDGSWSDPIRENQK